jgi:hypothetical protein
VHPDALRDLLLTAWRFMSANDRRRARRPGIRTPSPLKRTV